SNAVSSPSPVDSSACSPLVPLSVVGGPKRGSGGGDQLGAVRPGAKAPSTSPVVPEDSCSPSPLGSPSASCCTPPCGVHPPPPGCAMCGGRRGRVGSVGSVGSSVHDCLLAPTARALSSPTPCGARCVASGLPLSGEGGEPEGGS